MAEEDDLALWAMSLRASSLNGDAADSTSMQ